MNDSDGQKRVLLHYLQRQRDALVWKLDGLSERQARWPVTPTGTNLLGLVKHVALMEYGYFGEVFGRAAHDPLIIDLETAEDNADFWATPGESIADVVDFFRRAWANTDDCVAALPLDATGTVPWWPEERRHPSLHTVLVHQLQESARHAGHADILRETIDRSVGASPAFSNLPEHDAAWWEGHVARLKAVAESFP
ncbi:MAG TPA: DinB family protein [Gryllotalpicola sp.]